MHGTSEESRTRVKFSAAPGASVEIGFEPIGTTFNLNDGEWLTLELSLDAVSDLEFVAWPNGVAVWLRYPGDYVVHNAAGEELDRL